MDVYKELIKYDQGYKKISNLRFDGNGTGGILCNCCLYEVWSNISRYMLFSLWFNRVIMGIVIGALWGEVSLPKSLPRGAILGTIVSFGYFISTGFTDRVAFLPGLMQGMIMEFIVYLTSKRLEREKMILQLLRIQYVRSPIHA